MATLTCPHLVSNANSDLGSHHTTRGDRIKLDRQRGMLPRLRAKKREKAAASAEGDPALGYESEEDAVEPEQLPKKRSLQPGSAGPPKGSDLQAVERKWVKQLEARRAAVEKSKKENPEASKKEILDINNSRPTSENAVFVHPEIARVLKTNQVDGVRFLWNNLVGEVDTVEEWNGRGCILAHTMGLGKSLQTIALVHTILTRVGNEDVRERLSRVLLITPKSTLFNWQAEFEKWVPADAPIPLTLLHTEVQMSKEERYKYRLDLIRRWHTRGGVLVTSPKMFTQLAASSPFSAYLLDPGPDIAVVDEGHSIGNGKTGFHAAVKRITTRRRVILTGTPLQNSLWEYFEMANWVRPGYLGRKDYFEKWFVSPICRGQYKNSDQDDRVIMKKRLYVLRTRLQPFVHRKDIQEVLSSAANMPPKYDYILSLRMTRLQTRLYNERVTKGGASFLQLVNDLQLVISHPRLLLDGRSKAAASGSECATSE